MNRLIDGIGFGSGRLAHGSAFGALGGFGGEIGGATGPKLMLA